MPDKKIYPECYVDNIIVYDYDGLLFSIEVTSDICRKHLSLESSGVDDVFEWEEHLQREWHGETYPEPNEITPKQMEQLVEIYHSESLKCTEQEVLGLMDMFGDKFKQYRNQ